MGRPNATALTLLVLALTLTLSGSSSSAAVRNAAPRPQTLLRLSAPVRGFAQDGSRIAWLTGTDGRHCTRTLHVRSLGPSLTKSSLQAGCRSNARWVSRVALAGSAVAWDSLVAAGGEAVVTARVPGRAHQIASIHGWRPTLAAAGNLLAFSTSAGVRRIVDGKARPSFGFSRPRALAAGGGRIAALGQELRPAHGCGCASSPDWRADGKIGFLSQLALPPEGRKETLLIDPATLARSVLTDDDRWRFDLDWSLDGTRLAYSYTIGNGTTVAVSAPDGSGAHDVGPGYEPALSPDGSKVAFSRYNGDFFVYVANAAGGDEQLVGVGYSPAWSPDGARLAFVSDGQLWVSDVDGSNAHRLGLLAGFTPDWSPDGTKLVYARHGIWVADANGSNPRQLTADGSDANPHWSPDGGALVFERSGELFIVNADGTGLRPLTLTGPTGRETVGEVYSPTGRRIASFETPGAVAGVALAGTNVAVGTRDSAGRGRLTLFAGATGMKLSSAALGKAPTVVGASARWVVFRTGPRTIRAFDLSTSTAHTLAVTPVAPIGLSVSGRRVAWVENLSSGARIRAVTLPA